MLILASNSPRRQQLLRLAGWAYQALPASIDESIQPGEQARAYVARLAEGKARRVRERLDGDGRASVIVAADTTVVLDGEILGKPANPDEARAMLVRLRGRAHQVHTGLAVLNLADERLLSQVVTSTVFMRNYLDEEIQAYVESGDPMDKAGGYAIQQLSFHPVESLDGCYANVVGMPLCRLAELLKDFGHAPAAAAELVCAGVSDQTCPVAEHFMLPGRGDE